jgi:pilus assembly protein Flp/PilA
MTKQIKNFLKNESGAAAVEYGLLVSCISLVIIPSVKSVGQQLVQVFTQISNAL